MDKTISNSYFRLISFNYKFHDFLLPRVGIKRGYKKTHFSLDSTTKLLYTSRGHPIVYESGFLFRAKMPSTMNLTYMLGGRRGLLIFRG